MRLLVQPLFFFCATVPVIASGCASATRDSAERDEAAFTSASATLDDLEFDGELTTADGDPRQAIKDQMLFTIGQLNGNVGVGRLDKIAVSNIRTEAQGDVTLVRYHAKLPVSHSKHGALGSSYTLTLPRRVDAIGQEAFFQKYQSRCTDWAAHDNETGIYWYYYRPSISGCVLDDADVVRMSASVTKDPEEVDNTYPEYDKVWEDDVLEVVAIFGKVEDGATTSADRGVWSHGHFVDTMRAELPNAVVTPEGTPANPGVANPDVTIESTLPNGKRVRLTSFLVDNVRQGGAHFERRYNELSGKADIIAYNGHAGLGQNVRALARMGSFQPGKYQIIYMNGCDTFAYVDGTLAQTRAALNPDDPTGTKYMEIITNSMPPNWDSLPNNTMSLVRDLMNTAQPAKYKDVLAHFDQSGYVVVTGDEDNQFRP